MSTSGEDFSFAALNRKRGEHVASGNPQLAAGLDAEPISETAPEGDKPARRPGLPFDPRRVIAAIYGGAFWILVAAVAGAGAGAGAGILRFKNLYTGSTALIRQDTPNTFQTSESGESFRPKPLTASTLVSVMRGSALLKKVAAECRPPLSPGLLAQKLTVTPERNTDVIKVDYEGWISAEATALMINQYAAAVVQLTRDLQMQEAAQVNQVLQQQLANIDAEIAEAGEAVLAYSKVANLVNADKEMDAYLRDLGELSLKYESSRIEFETIDLKVEALRRELARQNPLGAKLQQAREALNELLTRYTEAHPAVAEQQQRVDALEKEMAAAAKQTSMDETQFTTSPAGTSLYLEIVQLRAQRETQAKQLEKLAAVRDAVQARLSALPEKSLQLTRIKARQQSLEKARTLLGSRQREAQLFAENAPGYYRVLAPASLQDVGTKSRSTKVAILAVVLGLLGGGGVLLLLVARELLDRTIKTDHDCGRVTNLPVLLRLPVSGNAGAWGFRAWRTLATKLQTTGPGKTVLCGVTGGNGEASRLILLLADAAVQRGKCVIALTTREPETGELHHAARQIALAEALASPGDLADCGSAGTWIQLLTVARDWAWTREQRQHWHAALNVWQRMPGTVILVELDATEQPDALLFAETLPNLLYLSARGERAEAVQGAVQSLREANARLSGAVFGAGEGSPPFRIPLLDRWLVSALVLLLAGLALSASAAQPGWQERLTLGPGDTLNFALYGHPDFGRNEVPVNPDGKISYLDASDIDAAGKTIDELRALFDARLGQYYRDAHTIITPALIRSKQYFILGKVIDKGAFSLDRPMTILEAVARSRGLETGLFEKNTVELADLPRSFLVRHGQRMKIDFEALFQRGDMNQNAALEPDDYLYFPSANVNEVYVLGCVASPGVQGFTPNATVVSMVTVRGGFTGRAYLDRVLVVRGSLTKPQAFVVNVRKILKAQTADFQLQPKDIIFVSEKPWARAEDLLEVAIRSFVQSAASSWATGNVPALITSPIVPSIQ